MRLLGEIRSAFKPPAGGLITEFRAGFTTFLTMAYILFVNPQILGSAIDVDAGQLMTATAVAAAFGTFLMGVLARYPFALAPGMGLNAYFAYTLVGKHGLSWQQALACVSVAGIFFILLSASGLRKIVVESIPLCLKQAMAVGIGLLLAFIGMANAGIITDHPATLVGLGDLRSPSALICLSSTMVASYLLLRGWKSAVLVGIVFGSTLAVYSQAPVFQGKAFPGFADGILAYPVYPSDLVGKLDFSGVFSTELLIPILLLLFVDFFDTAGTLYGLASRCNFLDQQKKLPRANRAFLADALATTFSGFVGTSPTTTFIESGAGIESGGRTGLSAIFVSVFFLCSLFFWPLLTAVPAAATSSALILVGSMMMGEVSKINWANPREGLPAFLTIIVMPLSYSISDGIAFGIITYGLLSLASFRFKSSDIVIQVLAVVLVLRFWFVG